MVAAQNVHVFISAGTDLKDITENYLNGSSFREPSISGTGSNETTGEGPHQFSVDKSLKLFVFVLPVENVMES